MASTGQNKFFCCRQRSPGQKKAWRATCNPHQKRLQLCVYSDLWERTWMVELGSALLELDGAVFWMSVCLYHSHPQLLTVIKENKTSMGPTDSNQGLSLTCQHYKRVEWRDIFCEKDCLLIFKVGLATVHIYMLVVMASIQ